MMSHVTEEGLSLPTDCTFLFHLWEQQLQPLGGGCSISLQESGPGWSEGRRC